MFDLSLCKLVQAKSKKNVLLAYLFLKQNKNIYDVFLQHVTSFSCEKHVMYFRLNRKRNI